MVEGVNKSERGVEYGEEEVEMWGRRYEVGGGGGGDGEEIV